MGKSSKIFISYAREDYETAELLHGRLIAEGFFPWMDKFSLRPGDDFHASIRTNIATSAAVIILCSKSALDKRGFFQREVKYAIDQSETIPYGKRFIIPVRLDDCQINDPQVNRYNYHDLFPDRDKKVGDLINIFHWSGDFEASLESAADRNTKTLRTFYLANSQIVVKPINLISDRRNTLPFNVAFVWNTLNNRMLFIRSNLELSWMAGELEKIDTTRANVDAILDIINQRENYDTEIAEKYFLEKYCRPIKPANNFQHHITLCSPDFKTILCRLCLVVVFNRPFEIDDGFDFMERYGLSGIKELHDDPNKMLGGIKHRYVIINTENGMCAQCADWNFDVNLLSRQTGIYPTHLARMKKYLYREFSPREIAQDRLYNEIRMYWDSR